MTSRENTQVNGIGVDSPQPSHRSSRRKSRQGPDPVEFGPDPMRCWTHLQPDQGATYFPELVSTFGAQAFAAHWSSDQSSAEKSERSERDSAHITGDACTQKRQDGSQERSAGFWARLTLWAVQRG